MQFPPAPGYRVPVGLLHCPTSGVTMRATACLLLLCFQLHPVVTAAAQIAPRPSVPTTSEPAVPMHPAPWSWQSGCQPDAAATTSALQLLGGLRTGAVAGAGTVFGAFLLDAAINADRPRFTLVGLALAYPAYVAGSAWGVYRIGGSRGREGGFWPTLLGSALGFGSPGATIAYHLSDPTRHAAQECAPAPAPLPAPAPGDTVRLENGLLPLQPAF